jgi:hypothetical protein
MSFCVSSTPVDEQRQRQQREFERAQHRAINSRAELVATGREALTEHGRQLLGRKTPSG